MDRQKRLKALPTDLQIRIWRDEFVEASHVKKQ
jgi:hypothetical protein